MFLLHALSLHGCVLTLAHALAAHSNFIVSCILILGFYSAGKTSVTGLVSNALLVTPRVLAWLVQARASHVRGLPFSLFTKAALLPNTIDADFRFKDGYFKGITDGHSTRMVNLQSTAQAAPA